MAKTQMSKVKAIIMEVSSNQTQMESQDKHPPATVLDTWMCGVSIFSHCDVKGRKCLFWLRV